MHILLLFIIWTFLPAVVYCNNANCKVACNTCMYDSMRRSGSQIFQKLSSETIDASVSWCKDGIFTRRDLGVIHYTATKIVETLKLKLSCSVTNTSWSEWSRTLQSFQTLCCVCFEDTAFVSNTLLHSFQTHYCVPLEHTTAVDSVPNECSVFASKRRRTHQDVNTDAGECRVRPFRTQLCFFLIARTWTRSPCIGRFSHGQPHIGTGSGCI